MSSSQNPGTKCPSCGASNASHARFCTSCGNSFSGSTQVDCPSCGVRTASNARFCTSCGFSFFNQPEGVNTTTGNSETRARQRVSNMTSTVVERESTLSRVGFALALVAIIVFAVALIPCLGCINWLNIPFAIAGAIINIIVMAKGNSTSKTIIALGLCGIAIVIGAIRLVLGAGVV